jgi:hypothetical protein
MFRTGGFIFKETAVHTVPPTILLIPFHENKLYHTCRYNRLPEDEPSGSKHVEGIVKIKILL